MSFTFDWTPSQQVDFEKYFSVKHMKHGNLTLKWNKWEGMKEKRKARGITNSRGNSNEKMERLQEKSCGQAAHVGSGEKGVGGFSLWAHVRQPH